MLDALTRLARADVAIVISSRAPFGRIPDPPTGGTGSPLAELPLISAGPLTTEKAWVLLSAVLGQTATTSEARSLFGAHTKD
jgi:L-asparaginase/Glu-tRNA(Gln) amidotransferase subunit D